MTFRDPPLAANHAAAITHEARPAVYWFWSEIPTASHTAKQLEEIVSAGFSTVLIQTRLSFPLDHYLSDTYLMAYRTAVQLAKDLGLKVGIYDEYAWISGHGGGRTVAGADHLRERHLFWTTSAGNAAGAPKSTETVRAANSAKIVATSDSVTTTEGTIFTTVSKIESWWIDGFGGPQREWLYDDGVRRWDDWDLVAAVAHPKLFGHLACSDIDTATASTSGDHQAQDVTAHTVVFGHADGCTAITNTAAEVPDGWVVTVFVSARCATSRMVNYLDSRTAKRFIEVAYEPYARACEGLLGDPVLFFSFDHPYGGFYQWREGKGSEVGNSLMWDSEMTAIARSLASGRLADNRIAHPEFAQEAARPHQLGRVLLQIVRGRDASSRRTRAHFFAEYSRRGIESFFAPLRDWADAHGVGLSGHELLACVGSWGLNDAFPEVDARTNFGLDYFAVDRYRTTTLVDASNFEPQISPKMGDSVARAHGQSRCIVEQYAARNDGPGHYAGGYWELQLDELRLQTHRLHILGCRQLLFHAYGLTDGTGDNVNVLTNPRFDFPPTCNFEPWFRHFRAFADESSVVSAFIDGAEPVRSVALVYPIHTVWADGPNDAYAQRVGEWARLLSLSGIGYDIVDDRALARAIVKGDEIEINNNRYRSVILAGARTLPSARCIDVLESLSHNGGNVIITAPLTDLCIGDESRGEPSRSLSSADIQARLRDIACDRIDAEVPGAPPAVLLTAQDAVEVEADSCSGTVWSWAGRDSHGYRVVLLNDSPDMTSVRITAPDHRTVTVDLEPEEIICLELCTGQATQVTMAAAPVHMPIDTSNTITLDRGWTFTTGACDQTTIDVYHGWERQGYSRFSGEGVYTLAFDAPWLDVDADGTTRRDTSDSEWILALPEVNCAVSATLNDTYLGARAWRPFRFVIPPTTLRPAENRLTLKVSNTAANYYYGETPFQAGFQPSGITAPPQIVRSGHQVAPRHSTRAVSPT